MDDDREISESGQPIYRHKPRAKDFEFAIGDEASMEAITAHVEQHLGPIDSVFHELISDLVHVDVHLLKPRPDRDFYTLFTTGMSDRPMTLPEGSDVSPYAEMMICLPKSWPIGAIEGATMDQIFPGEEAYWPVRLLKVLSRLPHEYDTWLGWGHTVPNGDPAEPYASNTGLCCAIVLNSVTTPDEFDQVEVAPGKVVQFLAVVPLYKEEMDLKMKKGADALIPLFIKHGVNEVLDVRRKNVAKRSIWPF